LEHDGRLYLVIGDPGAGKDSFIYHNINNLPFVLVQEASNNETMDEMFFLTATNSGIEKAQEILTAIYQPEGYIYHDKKTGNDYHIYQFAVFSTEDAYEANPKIWGLMKRAPLLWLGDVNWWCAEYHRMQKFIVLCRNIRGRNQIVWGSTHRTKADLNPLVYQYARRIYWVGPFADEDIKLKELYGKKSAGLFSSFEEFNYKIRGLEKFNALDPNPERSVLIIKDETA
jgi:hypothetical protein